jgi:hypothetical protein
MEDAAIIRFGDQTDAELMADARTDPGAYRAICDRHGEAIYAFHRGRTRDHEVALDLTAETLAQARDLAGPLPGHDVGRVSPDVASVEARYGGGRRGRTAVGKGYFVVEGPSGAPSRLGRSPLRIIGRDAEGRVVGQVRR